MTTDERHIIHHITSTTWSSKTKYEAYHTIHKTATAQQTGKRDATTATSTANNIRQNFIIYTE